MYGYDMRCHTIGRALENKVNAINTVLSELDYIIPIVREGLNVSGQALYAERLEKIREELIQIRDRFNNNFIPDLMNQ